MDQALSPNPTTQEVYEFQRAYFSRPGAVLAKIIHRYTEEGDPVTSCLYRTQDGNKCAVGCLIPDSIYDKAIEDDDSPEWVDHETIGEQIEGNPVDEVVHWPELRELLNGESEEGQRKLHFLEQAQQLHDNTAKDAADLVRLLDVLAHEFHLQLVTS